MAFNLSRVTLNEGIAIDASLVQFASNQLSKERLQEEKAKRETPEGNVDKNVKPLKFSRDLESAQNTEDGVAMGVGRPAHGKTGIPG